MKTVNGQRFAVIVITDCNSSNTVDDITYASSGQLINAITDTWQGGIAGIDHAWYDKSNNQTISSQCPGSGYMRIDGAVPAYSYLLHQRYSPSGKNCILAFTTTTPAAPSTTKTSTTTTSSTAKTTTTTTKTTTTTPKTNFENYDDDNKSHYNYHQNNNFHDHHNHQNFIIDHLHHHCVNENE